MGIALEVITGRALNPGATITAATVNTGDTFRVRAFNSPGYAHLEGLWAQGATAGVVRARSPKFHDNIQGIRYRNTAAIVRNLLSDQAPQQLYSTDDVIYEISGGGAETDAIAAMIYYSDLPGADAALMLWDQVKAQIVNLLTVEVQVTGPTTAGDWSAGNAINSFTDLLKADARYAILGYTCDAESLAVGIRGPDTSNYRVGGPGCVEAIETRDWFVSQAVARMTPHIPVIKGNNDGATFVHTARVTAGGTQNVCLSLAELAS